MLCKLTINFFVNYLFSLIGMYCTCRIFCHRCCGKSNSKCQSSEQSFHSSIYLLIIRIKRAFPLILIENNKIKGLLLMKEAGVLIYFLYLTAAFSISSPVM